LKPVSAVEVYTPLASILEQGCGVIHVERIEYIHYVESLLKRVEHAPLERTHRICMRPVLASNANCHSNSHRPQVGCCVKSRDQWVCPLKTTSVRRRARMKARPAFLGGRSAKVDELKERIEKALSAAFSAREVQGYV